MANVDVGTPRFYCDYVNYLLSRGVASSAFALTATNTGANITAALTSGTADELFDMKPLNQVTFTTNTGDANADHILLTFDLHTDGFKPDFVAILNHNMHTADADFRIAYDDTLGHLQAVDHAASTRIVPTRVLGACTITESDDNDVAGNDHVITRPTADGHTIVKFTGVASRYWGIQICGNAGENDNEFDGTTNLSIGCILLGQYYDMPHSPDMTIKRSIVFDGVKINKSLGGQRYGTITNTGRSAKTANLSPFQTYNTTSDLGVYGGRMSYDLAFSYLNSTDVMPNEYHTPQSADSAVVEDVWNKTNGRHIPFIFSIDKSSEGDDAESEHMFARFGQDSLDMGQVAHKLWNIQMKIDEEF